MGRYTLIGTDLRPYVGKRVQVKSASPNRLRVVGGLWPTPNVAAQAGAIDPAQVAAAALPGGGSGWQGTDLCARSKVASVRVLSGSCR